MKYGIRSVTMDDIASQCGVSKKTLYQYFENKTELVDMLIRQFVEQDQARCTEIREESSSAIEEMLHIVSHVKDFVKRMSPSLIFDLKKYYKAQWKYVENEHFSFISDIIRQNILRGKEEQVYRQDTNEEVMARLYLYTTLGINNEQIFPSSEYSKSELFEIVIINHLRSLVSDNGAIHLKEIFKSEIHV